MANSLTELQQTIQSRQKLESQQQENKQVQKVRIEWSLGSLQLRGPGIRRIRRRCEYLQASRTGIAEAGQGRSRACG